ncbi:hypothetical protein CCACVL1_25871 [Corchorus capsularis]|uniref:Uncharacterized protein n=1 Tax=Corchorus capsularis TaxID=210143 RepID=A0A1R3GGR1_COCAP|nr:hypothetical protein CCACVL1_25871 [Corchorus capsularis]
MERRREGREGPGQRQAAIEAAPDRLGSFNQTAINGLPKVGIGQALFGDGCLQLSDLCPLGAHIDDQVITLISKEFGRFLTPKG